MDNSTFFAALAGANGRDADDWANYAHKLEHEIAHFRRIVKSWQDNAIDTSARAAVMEKVIAELSNGRTAAELCGGRDNYLALVEKEKAGVRKHHGLE